MKDTAKKILVALAVVGVVLILLVWNSKSGPSTTSTSTTTLPFDTYTTTKDAPGGNSFDNLSQFADCISNSDQQCETAMMLDGRAFLVKAGTSIDGEEIEDGIFEGRVHSGALVGKDVYIPVGALK
ncbi:MAG: hypothetical protein ACRD5K_12210 [Candidatus Acidiferrales bacterium]